MNLLKQPSYLPREATWIKVGRRELPLLLQCYLHSALAVKWVFQLVPPNTDWSVATYLWTGQIQLSGIWSKCKFQLNQLKHGLGAFNILSEPKHEIEEIIDRRENFMGLRRNYFWEKDFCIINMCRELMYIS